MLGVVVRREEYVYGSTDSFQLVFDDSSDTVGHFLVLQQGDHQHQLMFFTDKSQAEKVRANLV